MCVIRLLILDPHNFNDCNPILLKFGMSDLYMYDTEQIDILTFDLQGQTWPPRLEIIFKKWKSEINRE